MDIIHHREGEPAGEFGCAQNGCTACLEKLLQAHEGLIYFIVRRQFTGEAEYADLIQEGRIGLWLAILHYDAELGYTFSTYAGRAIRNRVWRWVRRAGKAQGWLEGPHAEDHLNAVLMSWQEEQQRQALSEGLAYLPDRLREVIELAYGWDGQAPLSLAAIGRQMGVTRERVRQVRNEALGVLALPVFSQRLRSLFDQDSRSAYRQARNRYDVQQRNRRRQS